jgi:hypothetical protein
MNRRDGKHSGMSETFETAAAELKSIAVRTAAIAETLATTGSPETSTAVIKTTGAETPATTAGTHGKPADAISSATAESVVTAKEAGLLRDRGTSNSSVSSNFATQEASK